MIRTSFLVRDTRLCWRTAAARTSTSVRSAAAPSSSPECCARFCRSESCVSRVKKRSNFPSAASLHLRVKSRSQKKHFLPFCAANEGCNDYHPMFFTHDRAWEEFFCVCIQLLNKTWKEMRATAEDFNKVHKDNTHWQLHVVYTTQQADKENYEKSQLK